VSQSSADPFDEPRRNPILYDRHPQDAVIVQHFCVLSEQTQTPIPRAPTRIQTGVAISAGERLPSPFKMNRGQLKMKDVRSVTT
jgi:hypothetical protein